MIKFVSDLRQDGGFFPGTPVSSTNKTDCHCISELLLKVTLNTLALTPNLIWLNSIPVDVYGNSWPLNLMIMLLFFFIVVMLKVHTISHIDI